MYNAGLYAVCGHAFLLQPPSLSAALASLPPQGPPAVQTSRPPPPQGPPVAWTSPAAQSRCHPSTWVSAQALLIWLVHRWLYVFRIFRYSAVHRLRKGRLWARIWRFRYFSLLNWLMQYWRIWRPSAYIYDELLLPCYIYRNNLCIVTSHFLSFC